MRAGTVQSARRSCGPPQARGEETVGTGSMRKGAKEFALQAVRRERSWGRVDPELRERRQKALHLLVALLRRERAECMDEQSAGADVALHGREEPRLKLRQPVHVLWRAAQLHLGVTAQGSQPRARGIEQDQVEALESHVGNGERYIGRAGLQVLQSEPLRSFPDCSRLS